MISSIQFTWICILAISFTYAARLDEQCSGENDCQGATNVVCRDGRCRCNSPFYKPCNSTCDVVRLFVYEGDACAATENCVQNAECRDGTCRCKDGLIGKNGACFQNLFAPCSQNASCWSEYCAASICQCPPGFVSSDNATTCYRTLVETFENWDEANNENAFCQNRESCIDVLAECYTDTAHPQMKYCRCPRDYQLNKDNGRRKCEPIQSPYFSPLETDETNYGECGTCADEHAACVAATGNKTCWCRAGYVKNGDKCDSRPKLGFVFPNGVDIAQHDFTSLCAEDNSGTVQVNGLCVCARGYEFDVSDRSCKKIELKDYREYYEYGLCTHIDSDDFAIRQNGICPEPLTCQVRRDKHVCSCGIDKFQDLDDPSECVYYIGKGANRQDRKCPRNTQTGNTDNCACLNGYRTTDDKRQCVLTLSDQIVDGSCTANLTDNSACRKFGERAIVCQIGECRCDGVGGFRNKAGDQCEAPLDKPLDIPRERCPSNSILQGNLCKCLSGYRPSPDGLECVYLTIPLVTYQGPSTATGDLNNNDCQELFGALAEVYGNDRCQCPSYAFVQDDRMGCRYQLNMLIPQTPNTTFCPLNSRFRGQPICECYKGYTTNGNTCVKLIERVYDDGDSSAPNIADLDDDGCTTLFGYSAKKSANGGYCICGPKGFAVPDFTRCIFYLNQQGTELKNLLNCPDNSNVTSYGSNSACECLPNYYATDGNRSCTLAEIDLVGTDYPTNNDACTRFSTSDCTEKFGAGAFCRNDACYCNRRTSVQSNNRCESLVGYNFPAEHDLHLHACNKLEDCNGKANVVCDYSSTFPRYKVCQCGPGTFLNVKTLACETRCSGGCNIAGNFECQGYTCRCKNGYFQVGSQCVQYPKLSLYERCNASVIPYGYVDESFTCNPYCSRAECAYGYRSDVNKCVKYQLQADRCIQTPSICRTIDSNSECSRESNQCLCRTSYYVYEDRCARGVSSDCDRDEECGSAECKAGRCTCREGQRIEEIRDSSNRVVQYCVNGIDRLRMNWLLLSFLFFVWARFFGQ